MRTKQFSALEEDILKLLVGQELYGLEISKATRKGVASLYPVLYKLERKGLINSRWGEETPIERGGARRRYYSTTKSGERALALTQRIRQK